MLQHSNVAQALDDASQVGSCTTSRYSHLETESQKEGGIAYYWFLYGEHSDVMSNRGKSLLTSSDTTPRQLQPFPSDCPSMFDANDCESTRTVRGCIEVFRSHLQREKDDCVRAVKEWNQKNPQNLKDYKVLCKKELTRLSLYLSEDRGGIVACARPAYTCGKGEAKSGDNSASSSSREFQSSSTENNAPTFSALSIANSGRALATVGNETGHLTYSRLGTRTTHTDSRSDSRAQKAAQEIEKEKKASLDLSKLPGGENYVPPEPLATCRLTRAENLARDRTLKINGKTVFAHVLPSFEGLDTLHLAGVQYLESGKEDAIHSGYNSFLPHADAKRLNGESEKRVRLIILCGSYKKVSIGGSIGAKIPVGKESYASKTEAACLPLETDDKSDPKHNYAVVTIEAHGTIYTSGQSLQIRGIPENDSEAAITCSSRVVLIGSGKGYSDFLAGL